MIIYSEKTGKRYETLAECMEAEEQYDKVIAQRVKQQELKKEKQEQEKKELDELLEQYTTARDKYYSALNEYRKKYKSPDYENIFLRNLLKYF